ncbi:MAG TPA: hypothetical protein VF503_01415 [Sphingobium sp.]|uniref:hypothetical protein n=1 Tax=Sphingobium sp. TaxID=1912891 RepID=UPI002ED17623
MGLFDAAVIALLPGEASWPIALLGGVKRVLARIWSLACRYPLQGIIILLVMLLAYEMHENRIHSTERDAARAEISAMNARTAVAAERIQDATKSMAASTTVITKGKNDAIAGISADRDALLEQLRARPPRTSASASASEGPTDGAALAGVTGAQLFREDAEFLAGEAADADITRVALKACYAQYDLVRQQLETLQGGEALGFVPVVAGEQHSEVAFETDRVR